MSLKFKSNIRVNIIKVNNVESPVDVMQSDCALPLLLEQPKRFRFKTLSTKLSKSPKIPHTTQNNESCLE